MPVAYVGAAAAVGELALNVSNSGGSSGGSAGGGHQLAFPGAADQVLFDAFSQMQPFAAAVPGQTIPGYQAYAANIQNNPFAQQQIQGAQMGAALGPQVSGLQFGGAQNLAQGAGQIMQQGFDPQQGLYNQLQNQTVQQANAANAMSGVSGPYAAGTIDQSLQNFNIGWQNNQLGREQAALGAAGTGFGRAGALGDMAIQTPFAAASLPYGAYLSQQQNNIGALGSLISGTNAAFGPNESLSNLAQAYLGRGQSGTALAQAGQAQQFDQNQTIGQNIGQGLSLLGGPPQQQAPAAAPSGGGGLMNMLGGLFGGGSSSAPWAGSTAFGTDALGNFAGVY